MRLNSNKVMFYLLFVLIGLSACSAVVTAQSIRPPKKSTPKKTISPAPTPQPNDAVIISRAEDFQNGNQIVYPQQTPPNSAETLEEKIDKVNIHLKEIGLRLTSLESGQKNEYDEKQKRLLLNLDILSKAEQRAESLRKQLFEMVEKENSIQVKLDQIENDIRPEMIDRSVAFAGTLRPEELRDARKKNLESEKRNLENLLTEIRSTKSNLETNVQKADALVEKLRYKLEADIDKALDDTPDPQ